MFEIGNEPACSGGRFICGTLGSGGSVVGSEGCGSVGIVGIGRFGNEGKGGSVGLGKAGKLGEPDLEINWAEAEKC
ncbi:hypothetical protein RJT34_04195 [Clitoria ternatea]|uniref:Uncharacterized protein n=1 Tax=Clitoria ternatea TaxID=43366 RepID=A0AAN9Q372_CLITE